MLTCSPPHRRCAGVSVSSPTSAADAPLALHFCATVYFRPTPHVDGRALQDDLIVAPGVVACVTMGIIIAVYIRVKQATERAAAGVSNKCAELATRYPGSSWEARKSPLVP